MEDRRRDRAAPRGVSCPRQRLFVEPENMWLILAAVVGMLVPGRLLFFVGLPIVATVRARQVRLPGETPA